MSSSTLSGLFYYLRGGSNLSQGENAKSNGHCGKEYWKSRLHKLGEVPGKYTKKLTHRKERREGKLLSKEE